MASGSAAGSTPAPESDSQQSDPAPEPGTAPDGSGPDRTTAPDSNLQLILTMDWDDGFIAWLDGNFIASANSPNSTNEPAYSAVATASHE